MTIEREDGIMQTLTVDIFFMTGSSEAGDCPGQHMLRRIDPVAHWHFCVDRFPVYCFFRAAACI